MSRDITYSVNKRTFSIEVKSLDDIDKLVINNIDLTEWDLYLNGLLGTIEYITLVDGLVFEIKTSKCVFRFDITKRDIERYGFTVVEV